MYGSTPTIDATDEAIVARRWLPSAHHAARRRLLRATARSGASPTSGPMARRRASRFYLGNYGAFSALHPTPLECANARRRSDLRHRAHNGVHFSVPFRVYECSLPAPR
jgi:hypothetical protein